ncbi:ATP-grasp domain-containing protein [bacterium]|nr:MAG: ATP-grasp domain-containing protein [bacterium]
MLPLSTDLNSAQFLSSNLFRVHDVRDPYPSLENAGLGHYADRALLMPGTVVIADGIDPGYLQFLARVDIGAPAHGRVIQVPVTGTLLASCPAAMLRDLKHGQLFEFFLPTASVRHLVDSLNHQYQNVVWGPSPKLAAQVNHKGWLRRHFEGWGQISFPAHSTHDFQQRIAIAQSGEAYTKRYQSAAVKAANLATGEGIEIVNQKNWPVVLSQLLSRLTDSGYTDEIIVERAYMPHSSFSVQLEITEGGPQFLAITRQIIGNQSTHNGNVISTSATTGLNPSTIDALVQRALIAAGELHRLGYRGYIGFDFIRPDTGEHRSQLFVLEANGRVTGAMYPLAVLAQVLRHHGAPLVIMSDNLPCATDLTWPRIHDLYRAAGILFDGYTGILPVGPRLLGTGKAITYAIGITEADVEHLMAQARSILSGVLLSPSH